MPSIKSNRIESIDVLRGLVMVIMALDHVRDYFHINAFTGNYPENLESTNIILFGTRFITHYCAPVFVFLAGTSAFLYGQNKPKKELSKFLITRGLWLIFVEIFINNFLWWFDVNFGFINLQVIWAIGLCMIVLGLIVYLPKRIILALGLLIVFGHNTLDGIIKEGDSISSILWYILHQGQFLSFSEGHYVSFSYPILPWIGVIVLGYCFGEFYKKDASKALRKKWLLYIGISAIVFFFTLRGFNFYADLVPWTIQDTSEKTVISFFNLTKYPPSLAYILITLGPALLFLYFIETIKNTATNFLLVFGRVPFFYYMLHIFFIHVAAIIGLLLTGKDWKLMILDNETMNSGILQGYGYPLFTVYLIWIIIILALYPICKTYMHYKTNNKDKWWLSYL
ncbi:putative membrane protein [Winogradskyella eximia]|uniref:Putative membrane protein n=1 Tax=Winogradskyella eximia TaxID=262006 RepID=A0A3D9H3B3_9FLAO|nr:heparan-alpha-glucosaminide N-acetyltransferase domain-containing protein [Winogradskyella eximia]RED43980.1 putative membrane protein [Winogradskyella eximia]